MSRRRRSPLPDPSRFAAKAEPAGFDPDDPDADDGRPSKSQLKREALELQALGREIAELPVDKIDALNLPEALRGAIDELRRTRSHEGRRRQLQFVGKQMRAVEAAPLAEQLAAWRLGSAEETLKLHEIERWRDELIADDAAVTRWAETHAGTDMQRLRSLVRAARKQAVASPEQRHGKAYRELFQYIKPWLAEAAEPESTDDEADDDTP